MDKTEIAASELLSEAESAVPDGQPANADTGEVVNTTNSDEMRRELRLDILADEIRSLESTVHDKVLEITAKVKEARSYFETNEAGETSWERWASDNLPFKVSRANQLLQIANAPSPKAELTRLREMGKSRSAKWRAKGARPSRDGRTGETDTENPDDLSLEPEREELRKWVKIALLDDIRRVLTFIKAIPATFAEITEAMKHHPKESENVEELDFTEMAADNVVDPANESELV